MHSISNTDKYAWLMINLLTRIEDSKTYSKFLKVKPGTAHLI